MKLQNMYLLSLFIVIMMSSCNNDIEKISGRWENNEVSPPPTIVTISINDDNISVNHEWRLEYNEHINGGSWFKTGNGQQTYNHATFKDKRMLVDGYYMIFSDSFTSLTWKGHTYYKVK